MDNKCNDQFIIIKSSIEASRQDMKSNKQDPDEKTMKLTEYFKAILIEITSQINTFKYSSNQKD